MLFPLSPRIHARAEQRIVARALLCGELACTCLTCRGKLAGRAALTAYLLLWLFDFFGGAYALRRYNRRAPVSTRYQALLAAVVLASSGLVGAVLAPALPPIDPALSSIQRELSEIFRRGNPKPPACDPWREHCLAETPPPPAAEGW